MFWLERSTAKMGYMLSAKELTITWGDDQRYWRWVSGDDSRFGLIWLCVFSNYYFQMICLAMQKRLNNSSLRSMEGNCQTD